MKLIKGKCDDPRAIEQGDGVYLVPDDVAGVEPTTDEVDAVSLPTATIGRRMLRQVPAGVVAIYVEGTTIVAAEAEPLEEPR